MIQRDFLHQNAFELYCLIMEGRFGRRDVNKLNKYIVTNMMDECAIQPITMAEENGIERHRHI